MAMGKRDRSCRTGQKGSRRWKKVRRDAAAADAAAGLPSGGAYPEQVWVLENANLEKFYKAQTVIPADEFDTFMNILRDPLPVSFRIDPYSPGARAVLDRMQNYFFPRFKDDQKPHEIAWYPVPQCGWQIDMDRRALRRDPVLKEFHRYLTAETNAGSISRQEQVSMLPVHFFSEFSASDRILDMCAAPGSKTAQLLELLDDAGRREGTKVSGFVVANDANLQRCFLLSHQTQRLSHLFPHLVIINEDATRLPVFNVEGPTPSSTQQLKFDRILADVVCTGDGTFRKNPSLWRTWHAGMGNGLHVEQLRIARRGIQLLAVGGELVYSTCSLNPIEDEAVIAQLLRDFPSAIELVDCSSMLPALKRMPGVSSWTVFDKENNIVTEPNEHRHIHKSLFPPTAEESQAMHLERSMRVLPHQQNTGGFFIAKFRKISETGRAGAVAAAAAAAAVVASSTASTAELTDVGADLNIELPEESPESPAGTVVSESATVAPGRQKTERELRREEKKRLKLEAEERLKMGIFFREVAADKLNELQAYFKFSPELDIPSMMLQRGNLEHEEKSKRLVLVNPSVRSLLLANTSLSKSKHRPHQWNVVTAGLPAFESHVALARFRLLHDAVPFLHKHIDRSLVTTIPFDDFVKMIDASTVWIDTVSKEAQQIMISRQAGSFIVVPDVSSTPKKDELGDDLISHHIYLAVARAPTERGVFVFVAKEVRDVLKYRMCVLTGVHVPNKISGAQEEAAKEAESSQSDSESSAAEDREEA
jgi:tRNA (cytosine34-C5)-methyltransferase